MIDHYNEQDLRLLRHFISSLFDVVTALFSLHSQKLLLKLLLMLSKRTLALRHRPFHRHGRMASAIGSELGVRFLVPPMISMCNSC